MLCLDQQVRESDSETLKILDVFKSNCMQLCAELLCYLHRYMNFLHACAIAVIDPLDVLDPCLCLGRTSGLTVPIMMGTPLRLFCCIVSIFFWLTFFILKIAF